MTSADPTVTDPMNPQGWNRYSYVGNDPLAFTDPNGFSWLSSFFHSVVNFITHNPIVRAIVQIVATIVVAALLPAALGVMTIAAVSAAGGAAITTGLSGGNLGQILRAGAIAGATSLAFFGVGEMTNAVAGYSGPDHIAPQFGTNEYGFNVAGHALVGCGSSVASGGSCGSGALAAGLSAGAGPMMGGMDFTQRLVANTVLGGAGSVAGGGKFANGAVTGAFGYLFNACGGPNGCAKLGSALGFGTGVAVSAGCDLGTAMACVAANPAMAAAGAAAGAATGAAVDTLVDGAHGNSMDSQRQTYVYQLTDQTTGGVLKYGITSAVNPVDRYSASEYRAMNAEMDVIGSYPTRLMGRVEELRLNGNYVMQNGSFPPMTFRW